MKFARILSDFVECCQELARSHRDAWKRIAAGERIGLVLEADWTIANQSAHVLKHDFRRLVSTMHLDDIDLMWAGKCEIVYCTTAYFVKPAAAKILAESSMCDKHLALDHFMPHECGRKPGTTAVPAYSWDRKEKSLCLSNRVRLLISDVRTFCLLRRLSPPSEIILGFHDFFAMRLRIRFESSSRELSASDNNSPYLAGEVSRRRRNVYRSQRHSSRSSFSASPLMLGGTTNAFRAGRPGDSQNELLTSAEVFPNLR